MTKVRVRLKVSRKINELSSIRFVTFDRITVHNVYYMQEKSDIDKAIATLENGNKINLCNKYKKYLECGKYS